jgi:hypothetical protein
LYPILYRLEAQGQHLGLVGRTRWTTSDDASTSSPQPGRKKLTQQRETWSVFMAAVQRAAGLEYA